MKKRLISMLLTVLMVASLFSGMSLNAYAVDVFEYTMTNGDTVLAVCNANGLNYYTCKNAIMALNGFTSEENFRYIPVGKVIKLPVSNAAAVTIAANGTTSTSTTQVGSTTTTVSTTANANGDTIAFWLVPYTLQRGETVYSACNALGISYGTFAKQIQEINNIKSLSWVKAGQTLLFPSVKTPAVGVSCYEVRAHKVTPGETAYSMCNANGISYNGNLKLLQALNNKDNLNYVTSGSTFYMPVNTIITASTGASGSTVGSGSTAATATPAATATAAPVKKVTYALKGNSSTGGTVAFYVDGKVVTEAAAGDVVTVVPTPDNGKAVKSLSVAFSDGSAVPVLSGGDTFVMPTCAVTANVEYKGGYTITLDSNYTAYVKVLVDGVAGRTASAGSLVQIVSGDPSFSVSGKVIVTKSSGGDVTVGSDNSFKMPSANISIKVNLEAVKTYDFFKKCLAERGSFVLQSNGTTISKAAKGTAVTVLASPSIGYSVGLITIRLRDESGNTGTEFTAKNGVFTMPDQDVEVEVTFEADTSAIELAGTVNGTVVVKDSTDKRVTTGLTGEVYNIFTNPDTGYTAQKPTVKSLYDQTMVEVETVVDGSEYSFRMPGKGALVIATFAGTPSAVTTRALKGTDDVSSICTVYVNNVKNGTDVGENGLVNISTSVPDGYVLSRYEVRVGGVADQELTNGANSNSAFLMPNADVEVIAYVEAQTIAVKSLNLTNCSVKFVDSNDTDTPPKEVGSYKVGDTARIIVTAKDGYTVVDSQVQITGAVSGNPVAKTGTNGDYTFTMPAEGVKVTVDSSKTNFYVRLGSHNGPSVDGTLVVRIGLNGAATPLDTGTEIKAEVGTPVFIDLSDAVKSQGYALTKIVTTTDTTGRIDYAWYNTFSFPMPAGDVIVDAVMKTPAAAIKTDLANCTMETYLTSDLVKKVSTFYVGDEVTVKLIAKAGFYLNESYNTGSYVSISGAATSTTTVAPDGKSATITFTMPAGQVLVMAKAQTRAYALTVGGLGLDEKVNITADGRTVTLGNGGTMDVHVGQTVKVGLTSETAKTAVIDSVDNVGTAVVTPNSNKTSWSFTMPDEGDQPINIYTVLK